MLVHATTIARPFQGRWIGALLLGASGTGKSDLALRAIRAGWRLVADDYSLVFASNGRLFARGPERLQGQMEVRHLGIAPVSHVAFCELRLAVQCQVKDPERMPDPEVIRFADLALPCLRFVAFQSSAVSKLDMAIEGVNIALGETAKAHYEPAL